MAEFENRIQCQAQERDNRKLQAHAWISKFGAREKMKADEKAQDRTKESQDQEKDANVFVAPIRLHIREIFFDCEPTRSQMAGFPSHRVRTTTTEQIDRPTQLLT
jgi:hypothetical protein